MWLQYKTKAVATLKVNVTAQKIAKYADLIKEEKAKETSYDPSRFETNQPTPINCKRYI
jgi:hypothetical protein